MEWGHIVCRYLMSSSGDQSVCVWNLCAAKPAAKFRCSRHLWSAHADASRLRHKSLCTPFAQTRGYEPFASHGLGPRKLARRYMSACSEDEERRVGSFVAHVVRERSWAGRTPESTKWNRGSFPPKLAVSPVPLRGWSGIWRRAGRAHEVWKVLVFFQWTGLVGLAR